MRALAGRRLFLGAAVAIAGACQGSSPVTPGTLGPPPGGNNSGSVTGTVVDHDGRAAIPGATVLLAGVATSTDSAGRFTLSGVPVSGTGAITVSAEGHLFRGVAAALDGRPLDLSIDVIRDALPFSLEFYRAFVRNNFETTALLPTARWTRAPSFYLKTTVETSGEVVPAAVVARIRDVIANSVRELSGGRYEMAAFETGTDTRAAEDGWVTVTFYPELSGGAFGRSTVGGNTGTIELRYGMVSSEFTNPGNCLTPEVSLVDHEIVHTMGFWHTRNVFADSFSGPGCPGSGRPAHVRYHAGVMYSRPVGNRDPDIDPLEIGQTSARAGRPIAECRFGK
jgi:hypothetical protein